MRPHSDPYPKKGYSNTIALCSFFALIGILGLCLSTWQYQRGLEKEQLISERNHKFSFEVFRPYFVFQIEQGDRALQHYTLGLSEEKFIVISDDLFKSGKNEGYWHPLEHNIFQSDKILKKTESLCAAYSLWACQKALAEKDISGILRSEAWKPSMAPERHYAYAVQWAGLGVVAFIMALINLRLLALRFTHVFFDTRSTT